MFCNVCSRETHKPLCPACEALVRYRVKVLDEALLVLWRSIDDGALRDHRRDIELLRRCGVEAA